MPTETVYEFTVKTYISAEDEEQAMKLLMYRLREINGRAVPVAHKKLPTLDKGGASP